MVSSMTPVSMTLPTVPLIPSMEVPSVNPTDDVRTLASSVRSMGGLDGGPAVHAMATSLIKVIRRANKEDAARMNAVLGGLLPQVREGNRALSVVGERFGKLNRGNVLFQLMSARDRDMALLARVHHSHRDVAGMDRALKVVPTALFSLYQSRKFFALKTQERIEAAVKSAPFWFRVRAAAYDFAHRESKSQAKTGHA